MSKDASCPAFPSTHHNGWGEPEKGMTLRDYFAAKAMLGMLSDSNAIDEETGKKLTLPDDSEGVAIASYIMADAMMKAREQ